MGFFIKGKHAERCSVIQVPVASIIPNSRQPRHKFENDSLISLSKSIRHNGILQPLTVRENENGQYELVAGERRLRAAILAGYTSVPCITVNLDNKQSALMSLIENLQRENLSFFEEAIAIQVLIDKFGMTQEQVAEKLGKAQSTVANKLRLLRFSSKEREKILELNLTERHARALLRIDPSQRNYVFEEIQKHNLNVDETEKLVETILKPQPAQITQRRLSVVKDVRIFFNTINNAIAVMKQSGIEAEAQKKEYDDYFEYTVKIPKKEKSKINNSA